MNTIILKPGQILLIDGTIATDHHFIQDISDLIFFTEVKEKVRKKRFYDLYNYKGLSSDEIDILYHNSINKESNFIEQSI